MSGTHFSRGSNSSQRNKNKLKLYSNRFCPYSQRVRLVLDAKNIGYDLIDNNLLEKPEKSKFGKVPALELENEDVLYESLIICDYLDEKYKEPKLHPSEPEQKAQDRILIQEFSHIIRSVNWVYSALMIRPEKHILNFNDDKVITKGLAAFEKELLNRETPYFCGRKAGMLDYMIWPWCERADLLKVLGNKYSLNEKHYPALAVWRSKMAKDSAVKKSFMPTEKHLQFLNSLKIGFSDYKGII